MSQPTVPPRPQQRAQAGPTAVKQEMPPIPPRPVRKSDPSPDREAYTRSPLNFLPNGSGGGRYHPPSSLAGEEAAPARPSSLALPSEVGQEGIEYTSYDQLPAEAHGVSDTAKTADAVSEQTRNVSADLALHQPKASLPQSSAKSRIATVTRTDSTQAAAAGIGKARPDDDVHKMPSDSGAPLSRVTSKTYDDNLRRVPSTEPHPLKAKSSFSRSTSSLHNGTPRPPSIHSSSEHHEGIPEIGMQIPLYKNAGDVQAPSPAPTQPQFTSGIGFFNDGSQRAHHRKRSSRQEFLPPGSYGLHGHGNEPQDRFERDWLAKHPDEAMNQGYSPYLLRPENALSSDQLNRIVSESDDVGMGTSPAMVGTPSQEIAFEATDQWASRMTSPKPSPAPLTETKKRSSSGRLPPAESPLRKQAFSLRDTAPTRGDKALESEDEDVIHVDPPLRRGSKVTGGGAHDGTVDLGPTGGNTDEAGGWFTEHGEGTPILASDEILKRPSSAFLQPAVSPEDTRNNDDSFYDSDDFAGSRRNSFKPPSRPSSRPGSGYHGGSLHRFISHEEHHGSGMGTPLEEIEEYEPLFPEGEENQEKPKAFKKRPGLAEHHFPSQDIWEDTPSSLQYQTTVDTPEPPPEKIVAAEGQPSKIFETPEQEEARRTGNPADMTSDSKTFAKPHFKPGVLEDMHADSRPSHLQRFPSRDIWEDTPDSMRLVTTVSSPQMDETKSPPEDRPTTTALPGSQDDAAARATTGFTQEVRPSIPARPERKSKLAQEVKPETEDPREKNVPDLGSTEQQVPDRTKPAIPEKPKVPARPARPSHSEQAAGAPLVKTASATSAGSGVSDETVTSPPAPKAKPAVPARPAGSKIAALQSTFMNDLNNRLKLGPQGPPPKAKEAEPEPEAAKEPLVDARKGRAKGPARRKPAASPSGAAADSSGFSFSTPMTMWHIDEHDELNVAAADVKSAVGGGETPTTALERELTANETKNTQTPPLLVKSESMSEPTTATPREAIGAEGDAPPPTISPAVAEEQEEIHPALEASLTNAEPAPANAEEEAAKEMSETAAGAGQKEDLAGTSPEPATTRAQEEGDAVVQEGE